MIKILTLMVALSVPAVATAKNLGVVGKTYPFAEKDALAEVEERVKQVDWDKQMANLKTGMVDFKPELVGLPKVIANRTRKIDPNYTLDVDVPDPRDPSRVLYPKGFQFNPFQFFTLPGCVVFFNADDKKQVSWFRKSSFSSDANATILLTGGDVAKMEEVLNRPVTYATSTLAERFDIMAVPSVACQKGAEVEVYEYLP